LLPSIIIGSCCGERSRSAAAAAAAAAQLPYSELGDLKVMSATAGDTSMRP
jgi:hypothetical protein